MHLLRPILIQPARIAQGCRQLHQVRCTVLVCALGTTHSPPAWKVGGHAMVARLRHTVPP
jgi:hypothetical protein